MLKPFTPEPYMDFSDPVEIKKMEAAIARVEAEYNADIPLRIGSERIMTEGRTISLNPSDTSITIGKVSKANKDNAEKAMTVASETFDTWKKVAPAVRARYLLRAAQKMRTDRYYWNALMVLETGKTFLEADADTAESIDFMEFYAREMMKLSAPQELTESPFLEENNVEYIPLGVSLVIPPWNFPNAIMAGMTVASIVTGNTVVLKPSSDAPVIAYRFCELMESVGLPDGVINYCPGSGAEIGDYLVDHPKTRMVAFTGSMEVGLRITERAAKISKGQIWIKRVIAEMGGKDFIVAADDSDADIVAQGIVTAAFGFQGQKCSACSRAIIDAKIYDEVVEKVTALTKKLVMSDAKDDKHMGPVVSKSAFDSINEYIKIGKTEGRMTTGGGNPNPKGYFIEPTVFADIDENARIAQEEIFGPVVALIKAKDFDDAIRISNGTIFGLTGAVYSRDQMRLEQAREECHCGNLYLNRKCTGAIVDVHPFGGFNMSGTDSKAGGRDYLLLFMQAKTTTQYLNL
jgi:1-pyrroline-5-carboxylate dehydrogenase